MHCQGCNTVTGIYPGDFSTHSLIRFLQVLSLRRLPPLEMTLRGRSHFTENVFSVYFPIPPLSFRAEEECPMTLQPRIAAASRRLEIFLVFGNIEYFNFSISFADSASSRRIHPRPLGCPLLQGGTRQTIESPAWTRYSGLITLPTPRHFERWQGNWIHREQSDRESSDTLPHGWQHAA